MTRVSFGLVAMLVILSVVTGCTPTPATTRAATAPPPQVSAPTVVEARGDTVAPQYRPDELYEQLKNHPSRGPTVPPFFLYALPLEQLKDMANVKELSVLYRGEEKPWVFNTHYSGEGKSLGIAVAVVRPDSPFSAEGIVNREKRYVREEQSSAMQTWDITLVVESILKVTPIPRES